MLLTGKPDRNTSVPALAPGRSWLGKFLPASPYRTGTPVYAGFYRAGISRAVKCTCVIPSFSSVLWKSKSFRALPKGLEFFPFEKEPGGSLESPFVGWHPLRCPGLRSTHRATHGARTPWVWRSPSTTLSSGSREEFFKGQNYHQVCTKGADVVGA